MSFFACDLVSRSCYRTVLSTLNKRSIPHYLPSATCFQMELSLRPWQGLPFSLLYTCSATRPPPHTVLSRFSLARCPAMWAGFRPALNCLRKHVYGVAERDMAATSQAHQNDVVIGRLVQLDWTWFSDYGHSASPWAWACQNCHSAIVLQDWNAKLDLPGFDTTTFISLFTMLSHSSTALFIYLQVFSGFCLLHYLCV